MSRDVTRAEAERIAIERAKLQAIADEFGTVVHQENLSIVKNESGSSSIDFLSTGGTEVKGEWIEDISAPQTEMIMQGGELAIKATVKGRIREIIRAEIDISAKILRNGITAQHESDKFTSGDDVYLLFKSPQSGHLSVYLQCEDGSVYCLLPYQSATDGVKDITQDREYTLFHIGSADNYERRYVDEYIITSKKSVEVNTFHIIFSPNKFTKANLTQSGDEENLGSTELEQFNRWLANNRRRDIEMQVMSKSIEVRK